MRRLIALLLFLVIVNEGDPTTLYSKPPPQGLTTALFGPFEWVQGILLDPLPFKVRPFDLVMLVLLIVASSQGAWRAGSVRPMRNALLLATATVVAWFVYGIATGGDARAASWQVYLMLSAVLASFTIAANFRTAEHFALLAKAIVAGGLYRALLCWYFYFGYVVNVVPLREYVTAHDDSVVWVISISVMIAYALSKRRLGASLGAAFAVIVLLGAIQWNMRRLAWVSLVMSMVLAFFLTPHGIVRRRVVRATWIVAPIIALYVLVGWGRTERIFQPLQSLASVSTQEDKSTKARNVENLGLIATVKDAGALTGTGWGHGYKELSNKYSIAGAMELWPYIPHNSILGLLAYTGILGFAGYWLAFPTAVFLNARLAKMGNTDALRGVGFVSATSMIVCANQMYGDMGVFSLRTMYLLATTYAVALRLPILAGVWEARRPKSAGRAA